LIEKLLESGIQINVPSSFPPDLNLAILNEYQLRLEEHIRNNKGYLVSGYYITRESAITTMCKEGHIWTTRAQNLVSRHFWCEKCNNILYNKNSTTHEMNEKRSDTLKDFYVTDAGKQSKKESHAKRSTTMAEQRLELRKDLTEKACTKCSEVKPVEMFGKKTDTKDGYQPYCRACIAIAKKQTRDKQTITV
jgi:hypothetical protein